MVGRCESWLRCVPRCGLKLSLTLYLCQQVGKSLRCRRQCDCVQLYSVTSGSKSWQSQVGAVLNMSKTWSTSQAEITIGVRITRDKVEGFCPSAWWEKCVVRDRWKIPPDPRPHLLTSARSAVQRNSWHSKRETTRGVEARRVRLARAKLHVFGPLPNALTCVLSLSDTSALAPCSTMPCGLWWMTNQSKAGKRAIWRQQ